jgi:hypothetical protein
MLLSASIHNQFLVPKLQLGNEKTVKTDSEAQIEE